MHEDGNGPNIKNTLTCCSEHIPCQWMLREAFFNFKHSEHTIANLVVFCQYGLCSCDYTFFLFTGRQSNNTSFICQWCSRRFRICFRLLLGLQTPSACLHIRAPGCHSGEHMKVQESIQDDSGGTHECQKMIIERRNFFQKFIQCALSCTSVRVVSCECGLDIFDFRFYQPKEMQSIHYSVLVIFTHIQILLHFPWFHKPSLLLHIRAPGCHLWGNDASSESFQDDSGGIPEC